MAYYRSTDTKDRARALAGVLLVHAALGALVLSGLNVRTVREAVERLKTFDISEEPPPPPVMQPPPPPRPEESSAPRDEAAPANIQSRPTPVVAPEPRISLPVPLPVSASEVPGPEGADRTAGASNLPGAGTGAGGAGSGFGGGGTGGAGSGSGAGSGDGRTPARLLNKIPDREYRRISGGRIRRGSASISLRVNPDGTASNCRVVRSSGDPQVDQTVCAAAVRYLRFRPARDADGRPIAQDITYTPTWRPN